MKLIFICFSREERGVLDIRMMKLAKLKDGEAAFKELASPLPLEQLKAIWRGKCTRYLEKPREARN